MHRPSGVESTSSRCSTSSDRRPRARSERSTSHAVRGRSPVPGRNAQEVAGRRRRGNSGPGGRPRRAGGGTVQARRALRSGSLSPTRWSPRGEGARVDLDGGCIRRRAGASPRPNPYRAEARPILGNRQEHRTGSRNQTPRFPARRLAVQSLPPAQKRGKNWGERKSPPPAEADGGQRRCAATA